ncbi:MAB_1171c family putative transporter [Streptomyces roseoverticillatus]|uniref:MAB_1171c family putative transporter n=1 Tax=Streptomyces roseoverticillatus TaxID=66429 RepID=UPI0033D6E6DC
MIGIAFFAVLGSTLVWKICKLRRDRSNVPLRQVTWCLAFAAASYLLTNPGGATGFDMVAGRGTAKVWQNILLMVALHFLMRFYLYSASDRSVARRRAYWEGFAVAAAVAVVAALGASAPSGAFVGSYASYDMSVPQVAGFYLVAGLYMCYSLTAGCWWTCRYARGSERPLSTGLWLAASGLFGMALACAVRAVFVIVRSQGHAVSHPLTIGAVLLLVGSTPLFVIGVSYPGGRVRVAAVGVWLQHRRTYHQLEPLWALLTGVYPQMVLPSVSKTWRDGLLARSVHRRYHRRLMECRDGLVRISPHLGRQEDGTGDLSSSAALAQHLRAAAEAVRQGASAPSRAIALAVPHDESRAADVQQLVAVSLALRNIRPDDVVGA